MPQIELNAAKAVAIPWMELMPDIQVVALTELWMS